MGYEFHISDYRAAIFYSELPVVTVYPFKNYRHSAYSNVAVPLHILSDDTGMNSLVMLRNFPALEQAVGCSLENASLPLVRRLFWEYQYLRKAWYKGFTHIETIIDEPQSRLLWSSFLTIGLPVLKASILNQAQLLWVHLNRIKEQRENADTQFSMFEYLSAYVNPEAYSRKQEQKNARVNAAFESQHEALLHGDLDMLDSIEG